MSLCHENRTFQALLLNDNLKAHDAERLHKHFIRIVLTIQRLTIFEKYGASCASDIG